MMRDGLPGYMGIAGGLLYFGRGNAQLARHASLAGRHMFALQETEYGMRLGILRRECYGGLAVTHRRQSFGQAS